MSKRFRTTTIAAIFTIFAAVSLPAAWLQQIRPATPQSPRSQLFEFGVIGDGVADDTPALQSAIDSGLGEIVFPKGVYRLTKPLVIDLDKVSYTSLSGNGVARIEMYGAGPAIKFVGTHFKSADPGAFTDAVWDRQRMPLVDGIAITGKHAEASGIAAIGTMQLTVTRTHIREVLHGIHLLENNRNVTIADSHIYENRGVGIFYDDVNLHQSNIVNCHISYNAMGGVVSRKGNVRNIHISGCDIESNMSPNTEETANVLIDCRESRYGTAEVAITGCTIQHNNPSPNSANIRMIGHSLPGRDNEEVREGNVTISGNVFSDVQVNVHLKDCRGVAITGNTFWQGYAHNLLVEDCSNIVVGSNNLDRNPRYNYGNTSDANNGVVFRNSKDCTVSGLHITNVWRSPAGMLVEQCERFNITNCSILDCDNCGLLMRHCKNSRVSDCLIRDDREGQDSLSIRVDRCDGLQLADNLVGVPVSQTD